MLFKQYVLYADIIHNIRVMSMKLLFLRASLNIEVIFLSGERKAHAQNVYLCCASYILFDQHRSYTERFG